MLNLFFSIKKLFNILLKFLITNYKIVVLSLIIFSLIFLFLKFKKNIIKKIKQISNNIYKIKFKNLIFISIITILFAIVFEFVRYFIPNILDIHLGLNLNIDFLTSYSCILGLILPLAILLIEKIHDKHDYILIETYLKNTLIFPFIIYFCINLIIVTFINEKYYFIITSIISVIFIMYMYYKSFKLLSDLRYEQEKISEVRYDIINSDLNSQIKHFDESNKISNYLKYGIKVENYDYINTIGYERLVSYPSHDLRIIESYNLKLIDKITKELKIINKEYIEKNSTNKKKIEQNKSIAPNIVIGIQNIGATLMKDNICITIYYKDNYFDEATKIKNMISDKIYSFSENNYHFYVKSNYEYLEKDCVEAINNNSDSLFSNALNKYYEIYKDYVNSIKQNIGDYTYEVSYNQLHSIIQPRAYELLDLIRGNIISYSNMIIKKKNYSLMNELTNFLYKMMLYSYNKKELLSIQYLYSLYNYLNSQALKLSENHTCEKIKLEIFEFINIISYDMKPDNADFQKDVLLICNKNLGNMIFSLSKSNNKYFDIYLHKNFKFIKRIFKEYKQIKNSDNEKNIKLAKAYYSILQNYNCNIFATLSYIVIKKEKNNEDISNILNYYKSYSVDDLTSILLECIEKDYNDKTYSWDLYEERDYDYNDGAFTVNTRTYLIHLYCLLINNLDCDKIKIPISYPLSTHVDIIKRELSELNNLKLIEKFDELILKIEEKEKEYLRTTPIISPKINQFKDKFLEYYNKNATLYNLMKNTNNFELTKNKKRGNNYLAINNIVDKTYFLEKMPFDKTIFWSNFEDNYANCFIRAEESKFATLLDKHSQLIEENIIKYLDKQKKKKIDDLIIFADYSTIYDLFNFTDIVYTIPEEHKDKVLIANQYLKYNNNYIPIFEIEGLKENNLYIYNKTNIGKMQKDELGFQISIEDFSQNDKLLEQVMKEKVNGLELVGIEKRNHLLESIQLLIKEYMFFNERNMNGKKFKKKQ